MDKNNSIIIEDFDDRRWERSIVYQELLKIAKNKNMLKISEEWPKMEDDLETEPEREQKSEPELDLKEESSENDEMYFEDEESEEDKRQFEEDYEKYSRIMNNMLKNSEDLYSEGRREEAILLEKKAYAISLNLDKMREVVMSKKTEE